MPSAANPAPWLRICSLRPRRANIQFYIPIHQVQRKNYSTNDHDKLPKAPVGDKAGPNMEQQEHVSEEAAKMAKAQGMEGPDVDAGTPVHEILAEDKDFQKDAPKVLKEDLKKGSSGAQPSTDPAGGQKRSFSTSFRRRLPDLDSVGPDQPPFDPSMLPSEAQLESYSQDSYNPTSTISATENTQLQEKPGHKFPLPTTPPVHKNARHEAIVTQLTNLMMRDGKKSHAEKHMAHILNALRTAPSPTYNPNRPLLPGAPPASHLPLNPVLYLTLAVDSVAPLLRIRSQRGAAGGGVALQIPIPLGLRQRRRQAFTWIMDAAGKRGNREPFAQRVANEIISVVEGKSGVWEKRQAVHRLGTTARSNLTFGRRR
jgi:small subunit ribosomal protein S7